ncbi:MAG: tetratricopeptide repeat protein [Patescibacteria group bacterium]
MDVTQTSTSAGAPRRFAGLSRSYAAIVEWSLLGLLFLVPLFVLPVTVDALEVNKQTLLVIGTFVAALAWLGLMVSRKEVSVRHGWLNVLPVLLLVVVLLSAAFGGGGFVSWVGQNSQEYTSFLTTAALVVLFYLIVNNALAARFQKRALSALILSATLIGVVMALHVVNLPIMGVFGLNSRIFNPIGTGNAAALFLAIVTILANGLWLVGKARAEELQYSRKWNAVMSVATLLLSVATIIILAALDYWVLWVVLLTGGVALFTFAMLRAQEFPETNRFVLPMGLLVVSLLLVLLPTPLHLALPTEVVPSQGASWQIATKGLADGSYLVGSGPGTFIESYTKFHSVDLNATNFWGVRFDRGASHILTLLPTIGIMGVVVFLAFLLTIGLRALNRLAMEREHSNWKMTYVYFAAWFALLVATFLYAFNMSLMFLLFVLTALLASHVMEKQKTVSFNASPRAAMTLAFLFVLAGVGLVTGLFVTGQRYAAEVAFAKAVHLDQAGGDLDTIIQKLDTATKFNSLSDTYYRNLAQALLIRVQRETVDGVIPDDRLDVAQQLITASINSAKRATELYPGNVANWELLGGVYREIAAVANGAAEASIAAFEQARMLEPSSPAHLADIGRAYLAFAENARRFTESEDQATADGAKQTVTDNLKKAEDALVQAIALKTDYAPAHYYLGLVYERQGRLDDAITKMVSVKNYNPRDVGVAFELGVLYLRAGKNDLAQAEFERAVQLSPDYSNARWFLAAVYEQKGMVNEAIAQIEQVLTSNPDNELVKAKLERLRNGETSAGTPEPIENGEGSATDVTPKP